MKPSPIIRKQRGFFTVVVVAVGMLMSGITTVGVVSNASQDQNGIAAQPTQTAASASPDHE